MIALSSGFGVLIKSIDELWVDVHKEESNKNKILSSRLNYLESL